MENIYKNIVNIYLCRVSFGLYNINGSLNIIRNAVGNSVFDRQSIMRLVVTPVRTKPYKASLCHI